MGLDNARLRMSARLYRAAIIPFATKRYSSCDKEVFLLRQRGIPFGSKRYTLCCDVLCLMGVYCWAEVVFLPSVVKFFRSFFVFLRLFFVPLCCQKVRTMRSVVLNKPKTWANVCTSQGIYYTHTHTHTHTITHYI